MNVGREIINWALIAGARHNEIRPAKAVPLFELNGGTGSTDVGLRIPDGYVFLVLETGLDSYPLAAGRAVVDARRPYSIQDRVGISVTQNGVAGSTTAGFITTYLNGEVVLLLKGVVNFHTAVANDVDDLFEDTTSFHIYLRLSGLLFPAEYEGELSRYVSQLF